MQKRTVPSPDLLNAILLPTQRIQLVKMTDNPFDSLLEVADNFPLEARTQYEQDSCGAKPDRQDHGQT
jgi:hypothetical protein